MIQLWMRPCLFTEKQLRFGERSSRCKRWKRLEKKVCKVRHIKCRKRKVSNERRTEEKGKVKSAQRQNVQILNRVVISEPCSTFSRSSLSVMQHEHVRVQSPSLQVPWTEVSVDESDLKLPQLHQSFKWENKSRDPTQQARLHSPFTCMCILE